MRDTKFVPVGNPTDVGLVRFLQNADIPVHTEIVHRFDTSKVLAKVPLRFESSGYFFTACAVADNQNGFVNIYIKGAPDALLTLSNFICDDKGAISDKDAYEQKF